MALDPRFCPAQREIVTPSPSGRVAMERTLWGRQTPWMGSQGTGHAKREQHIEREPYEGPSSHAHLHPPEVFSGTVGWLHQGKIAIANARTFSGRKQHFWARGYFVSTVGRDENVIREYIKKQEQEDRRLDQLNMFE